MVNELPWHFWMIVVLMPVTAIGLVAWVNGGKKKEDDDEK